MTSVNPATTLQWLRSRSDMEEYLSSSGGKPLFSSETFSPYQRYAFREVEILPRVGTRVGAEHLEQGQTISYPIPRFGDLLSRLTLRLKLRFDHPLIERIVASALRYDDAGSIVGGVALRERDVAQVLHELAPLLKVASAELHVGNRLVETVHGELAAVEEYLRRGPRKLPLCNKDGEAHLFVELPFFFGKQRSDALPLLALTEHGAEVRLSLQPGFELSRLFDHLADADDLRPALEEVRLFGEYVFLGPEERKALLASPVYQRIVPQPDLYRASISGGPGLRTLQLPFRGPASELVVRFHPYGATEVPPFRTMALLLNRNPAVDPQPPEYFRELAQERHHAYPLPEGPAAETYLVAFGDNLDAAVPDGHIDLSAFDRVELEIDITEDMPAGSEIHVYRRGWNVFRVREGMGGLVYSR